MNAAILPAPQYTVPFDFAAWGSIPVTFGSVTITLAEARNLGRANTAEIERTLSDDAYAEGTVIRLAIAEADFRSKGLRYCPARLNAKQAARLKAAVARIEARLVSAQSLCAA